MDTPRPQDGRQSALAPEYARPDRITPDSRRRRRESHEAVLRATKDLLGEVGYQRLAFEGVARRAGVSKATIYRWWPNKAALVIEALSGEVPLPPIHETGDLEADLRTAVRLTIELVSAMPTCLILPALLADVIEDPTGTEAFAELIEPRRASVANLLERARLEGRLPPDTDTSLMVDIYSGTVVYLAAVNRIPPGEAVVDQLVTLLLHGHLPVSKGPAPADRDGSPGG
ncbi:TetR family transcriptional regulator [Streptomyces sp. NWU339]|uniref:TetR/AcrR family transcriptional regulator n=1 Tax=Streptomyces sp. NWU339 TaxID=2185284 RepID=UPI000D673D75|nr:TetR/AcrR family transcriptional regulator [Streptomyces sp. NWU339]PWI05564.1 TetR family transcriptional regulator [Streptomyces sp. NWU339]